VSGSKPVISLPYNVRAITAVHPLSAEDRAWREMVFVRSRIFEDRWEGNVYPSEKMIADKAGFYPAIYEDGKQFRSLIESTLIFKWVYTVHGSLRAGCENLPISHAVLAGGQPIFAGGEAGWFTIESVRTLVISNHSGHYRPSGESLDERGRTIWNLVAAKFTIAHRFVKTDTIGDWKRHFKSPWEDEKRQAGYWEEFYPGKHYGGKGW
jgi:hypothetical protein